LRQPDGGGNQRRPAGARLQSAGHQAGWVAQLVDCGRRVRQRPAESSSGGESKMLGRTQLIVGAVTAALAFSGGWLVNGWRWDAKLARSESQHAQVLEQLAHGTVAATQAARAEEARRTAAVEEQRDVAQQQAQALELDVAAAASSADRLRRELDTLRRRGSACSAATPNGGSGEQGTDTIGLLIDVLTGMESVGREVAEYADLLRIAGAACEGALDAMRAPD